MARLETLKKTGKLLQLLLLLLVCVPIVAQDVRVEASVSQNPVSPGESVNLSVTIFNSQGQVNAPEIRGLQYLYGPSKSSKVQTINGKRSVEYEYSWTFKALAEGEYEIPAIPVRTTVGVMKTEPFTLKVSKGQTKGVSGNFVVAIEPNKKKVYLGEPIVVAYKIYQLYGNFRPETYDFPEFSGFWPEKIEDHQGRWESQLINGQRYQVATIKIDVLFPQKTGKFTLDGFTMTGIVGSMWNRQRVSASSQAVEVEVLPHPGGKPEAFQGTFTQFNVDFKASTTHLKANEALTVSVTYSGKGNLRLLREPVFNWPPDLEVYDPEVKDRIRVTPAGVSGSRTYEYLVIPRNAGMYKIPGISASWFNPREVKYHSKSFEEIVLEVERGQGGGDLNYSFNSKSDVQLLNKDIRYIRPEPGMMLRKADQFFDSYRYYLLFILPVFGFVLVLFLRKKQESDASNVRGTRMKQAGKVARKWLKDAASVKNDPEKFYDALNRGLEQYVMDKFGIDRSALSEHAVKQLLNASLGEAVAADFIAVYTECAMARFAPTTAANPDELLNRASAAIKQIEENK